MDETLESLLLLNAIGADYRLLNKINLLGLHIEEIKKNINVFQKEHLLTENAINNLVKKISSNWCENELEKATRYDTNIIKCFDSDYPQELFDLKDAPLILYCKGNLSRKAEKIYAIVGTRNASPYAKKVAYNLGSLCSKHSCVAVSGGAYGIDSEVHLGVCASGGVTYSVLGSGVDVSFPSSNRELFCNIVTKGALISEFPMGEKPKPWNFPKRNRIIAALSEKLLVVEAPLKSGAMITSKIALELGREVWAVPGRITDSFSEGNNRLIFDGAYPYLDERDFFDIENSFSNSTINSAMRNDFIKLSLLEQRVLAFVKQSGEQTVDSIVGALALSSTEVLTSLSILIVNDLIYKSGTGRYSANI